MATQTSCRKYYYWICWAVFGMILTFIFIDNDRSLLPIPFHGIVSPSEDPYVYRFPKREYGPKRNKVIMVWSTYFNTYEWTAAIKSHLKTCSHQCDVTQDRQELLNSDAVLFHFTSKDLSWDNIPRIRKPNQVWCIYMNEPNPYVMESFSSWKNVFNWTVSYRKHSTVTTPYGMFKSKLRNDDVIYNPSLAARDKMAYAVISRCADDAKRYRLVAEIQKYINVDFYGECGNMTCDIKENGCLSEHSLKRYKFRLAFEDSNCRDYVTEKYWFTLRDGIIPVVNWKRSQGNADVIPNSFINVYDYPDIVSLTNYLKLVSSNETLFNSYFEWKRKYNLLTSFWYGFCNLCKALYNDTIPAQVYTDLEGWVRDDSCKRFTYLGHYRRLLDRFLYDGNTRDIL